MGVIGAISDHWGDTTGRFLGSTDSFLFSVRPAVQVCRSRAGCRNYAYFDSRDRQKPLGFGFGGQLMWVDPERSECRIEPTCGVGGLQPNSDLKISRLEVWGFGGKSARTSQQVERDHQEALKGDRSALIGSQLERDIFLGNTFAAEADAR